MTLTYAAPPAHVGQMLVQEDFQRRLCAATGDPAAKVTVTPTGGMIRVVSARKLPTDRLNDAMRAVIGHHVTVVETCEWPASRTDDGWMGHVVVAVEGKPVRLDATAVVTASDGGTTISYDGHLVARVPFVGHKVERAVEPIVRSALTNEERVGNEWLAEGR